jgi:tRNA(fMet)-specific endonuclease VapC
MEEEGLVVCDSDILIEFLDRGNRVIEDRLVELGRHRLCISSITHSEVIFGSLNKSHQKKLIKGLESFTLIEIDPIIDSIHRGLINRYSLSHKLGIQDAIVAATALKDNHFLYTLNRKDFLFIEGIRLIK